ncbi:MAG: hypothetical protein ISS47_07345 [Candidatus Omnitrophica bacterium]|nr:hypothetical protein [Candidatus Omnitrophota bacterium]
MERKKSIGIWIVGVAMLLYGFSILYIATIPSFKRIWSWFIPLIIFGSLVYIITSAIVIMLKEWARRVTLISSILFFIASLPPMIYIITGIIMNPKYFFKGMATWLSIFSFFWLPPLIFFIFLTRPKVKEQFRKEQ